MDASTIFQRTESGRETIKTKSQKLTQSERLLLIIIDGVRPLDVLRKEVWSLSTDRFERALKTLQKKELISEVLLPLHGQEAEQLDTDEVDRFLQQDPLDPVTIISFDPEDEFGNGFNPFAPSSPLASMHSNISAVAPELDVTETAASTAAPQVAPQIDEAPKEKEMPYDAESENLALKPFTIELVNGKGHEAEPFLAQTSAPVPQMIVPEPEPNLGGEWPENSTPEPGELSKTQWIYWAALIGGIGIIVTSLLTRTFT